MDHSRDVSSLDRCSLGYFVSSSVSGCLERASDSVGDIALGDKPTIVEYEV